MNEIEFDAASPELVHDKLARMAREAIAVEIDDGRILPGTDSGVNSTDCS